ncbi:phosphatases II [Eremomyces bilateralis CBS 781.70]|uniref:protein-tyrosine-phosphatase n=1 Tax=Eremomyces bilateralis CBS 781.70 TaxID=1392243 RepID=A0A6G1FY43_9PEZI|nr:phosphatases II [Eremomyces bilateralis CBS 781.70]KAF1810509.1 phosphatases II [Eremomyces bilateralis CBS 781.70]
MNFFDKVPGELKLFIGGLMALHGKQTLVKAGVTHVLSAINYHMEPAMIDGYEHFQIKLEDDEDEDIIQFFPKTNKFIDDALRGGGGVLVHCAMGKSRSATFTLAYLLWRFRDLDPAKALAFAREGRPVVEPNVGFYEQLQLYHEMGTPDVIEGQELYRRWQHKKEVEFARFRGKAPGAERLLYEDEYMRAQAGVEQEVETELSHAIRCRHCKFALAAEGYVHPHLPPEPPYRPPSYPGDAKCDQIMLKPLSWMRAEFSKEWTKGTIYCPGCKISLGSYSWHGGHCSCGSWVVPAIALRESDIVHRGEITDETGAPGPLKRGLEKL